MENSNHIPSAEETPAYCHRLSKENADIEAKIETNRALTELGVRLQREINANKNERRNQGLEILNEQVKLSEMLNEYFDLDETSKKARMLDLLSELNKLRTKKAELSKMIDALNKKYQTEKEMREEADEQLSIYDEEMKEMREEINKRKIENDHLLERYSLYEKDMNRMIRMEKLWKNLYKFGFYGMTICSIYFYNF